MKEKYTLIDTFSVERVPLYIEAAQNGCVLAFDTETTGLHNHDDIVQLAWSFMEHGAITQEGFSYVRNLSAPIDGADAQQVNGITDELLQREGKEPHAVYCQFFDMIREKIAAYGSLALVAHNLPFDLRMLYHNVLRYVPEQAEQMLALFREKAIGCDTKEFVKSLNLPKDVLPGNHLRNCITAFALDAKNTHDALDDTRACLELFKFLTH